jgi:hypothetical protein
MGSATSSTPLDEVFIVGLDRDSDLHLRAHAAVRDGRKGAAPMGNRYLLLNSEVEKTLHEFTFLRVSVAPFVDTARVGAWFIDAGLDFRVHVLNASVSVSIARDLKSGRTQVFGNSGRR